MNREERANAYFNDKMKFENSSLPNNKKILTGTEAVSLMAAFTEQETEELQQRFDVLERCFREMHKVVVKQSGLSPNGEYAREWLLMAGLEVEGG